MNVPFNRFKAVLPNKTHFRVAHKESQLAAGRKLARDLKSIRLKNSINVKEILVETRLADTVIGQLEQTALMANPMFNRVYLRSLFSAYGSAIGISSADMMSALEETLSGSYSGSLAGRYLEETSIYTQTESENSVDAEVPPDLMGESSSDVKREVTSEDDMQQVEVSVQSRDSAPTPGFIRGRPVMLLPNMSGLVIFIVTGFILIALIWFAISWMLSSPEMDKAESPLVGSTQFVELPRPERIILPDTFMVQIVAFSEALDPIRVKVDRDLLRPYWVEYLDTLSFRTADRVKIEREVANTRIFIDGYAVPLWWYSTSRMVDITRSRAQSWLDSLTAAGVLTQRYSATK